MKSLEQFSSFTRAWFQNTLGEPTPVQEMSWPAISAGQHTLVSAPTGTGKTLSAFLVFLDQLKAEAREGSLKQELQLIYISPLKSLAGDIRENLSKPLAGISREEGELAKDLSVSIRTGDTTQNERRKMIKNPPHILITTPESLYLMITSASGRKILSTAKAIIIDELHALIDSKRGAHLMLTIARLDRLCQQPLQRIGLSATIEPIDLAAKYLSPDPVVLAVPKMNKKIKMKVTSPFSDVPGRERDSVWKELAETLYSYCRNLRSALVFVEGRMYAERIAYYLNILDAEQSAHLFSGSDTGRAASGAGFARTHHGSLSKEQRFEVEDALRSGSLRVLCATSSMELGIDVGEIDQVFQIGCPRTISSTMQRLGRAGHNPGRTSVMYMFPRTASEGLYCGMTAEIARQGGVEHSHPPKLCLDVLAQHLVSMAAAEGSYHVTDVIPLLARAYPFADVTIDDVRDVLRMLAGDFEHQLDIPVRPRILYDRLHDVVEGDAYSRMLAISAGGTIPDRGMYTAKTENGVRLGELDEEFVFESRIGDRFILGTFAWQIVKQDKDTVFVKPASMEGAKPPFWRGDQKGRGLETGKAFGAILRRLSQADEKGCLTAELEALSLDETAAKKAAELIKRQLEATQVLPDDRNLVIEHYCNSSGDYQMMVHSIFGRRVNAPLATLLQIEARRLLDCEVYCVDEENGFMVYTYGDTMLPERIIQNLDLRTVRARLEAVLPVTPLFNMNFRYNTARALMMGVRKTGRQPLWLQRIRSAQMLDNVVAQETHPLVRETRRECLEDYWDLDGVEYILSEIHKGNIRVRELFVEQPSPMSLPLQYQVEMANMYDYAPSTAGISKAVEAALDHEYVKPAQEQLDKVSRRLRLPEDEKQLHSLLMIEGDMIAGEVDVPVDWLEHLIRNGQALYIEPGLWIAAEHETEYRQALEEGDETARQHIVRRALRYRGPHTAEQMAERYQWTIVEVNAVLEVLISRNAVTEDDTIYYHGELYERAQHETIKERRRQIRTLPPERLAALLVNRARVTAPAREQAQKALESMCGLSMPAVMWESVLLPGRVSKYRPEILDSVLAEGRFFWKLTGANLSFHKYDRIDWDKPFDMPDTVKGQDEKLILDTLQKRGASFIQVLSQIPGIESEYDALLSLSGQGLVNADSFMPVRQILGKKKLDQMTVRQRVNSRVKVMSAGRWDLVRPLVEQTMETILEEAFDHSVLLCRETARGFIWRDALEILRVWEYTGRVRRGYFIEGLSGAQFIRDQDFSRVMEAFEQPDQQIVWLPAVDPAQPWGKELKHQEGRTFLNVPGTVVCLCAGTVVAVFEQKGKTLRIFESELAFRILEAFVYEYDVKRVYPEQNRITIREYPPELSDVLKQAGFMKEMRDFVKYRGR